MKHTAHAAPPTDGRQAQRDLSAFAVWPLCGGCGRGRKHKKSPPLLAQEEGKH